MSVEILINKLKSTDIREQYEGWLWADDIGPAALKSLGEMFATDDQRLVRAAESAMDKIVHSAGKDPNHPKRAEVIHNLHEYLQGDSLPLKVYALRALSWVGGDESVPLAAKEIGNPDLREEAVFCLERIPGPAPEDALLAALPEASDEFKPRIIYALGHRKVEKAVEALVKMAEIPNAQIAIRAVEALCRIGQMPDSIQITPDQFRGWPRTVFLNSILRLADAEIARGNEENALRMMEGLLSRPEEKMGEHIHCAAIRCLAKSKSEKAKQLIRDAEAKAVSYIVKDTAKKALAV